MTPTTTDLPNLLAVARGQTPADTLFTRGRIINVFSGEVESADIAVVGERIAGIGHGYQAKQTVDLQGLYVAPGLIDAHVHIESSLCTPPQFARAVVPRGITSVVIDPHEIANVLGIEGIEYMAAAARGLPLRVTIMAPSCVPATHMGTGGATLLAHDLASLLHNGTVHGLAEVMNFPGVIHGDESVLAKLHTFQSRPIDGHAPAVRGQSLSAYVAAGIDSDHECTTLEEAKEKLSRGLYILIREASNAQNLDTLLPLITETNARRICFCTDDRTPGDLLNIGSIDYMVRRAIEKGVSPITAFRCATLNTAEHFQLHDQGAIAPGRLADFFVFDDLAKPQAKRVFVGGIEIRPDSIRAASVPELAPSMKIAPGTLNFKIPSRGQNIRVIESIPNQLLTRHLREKAHVIDGQCCADVSRDLLKMAVVERHGRSGKTGLGFIKGIGLKRGAIAGTVAHDHHNLVVIGCDDASMLTAARRVIEMGGGLCAAAGEQILADLSLPVAGLMTQQPIEDVRRAYDQLTQAAHQLGCPLHDPFMAMSFMALEVIPSLKLTDQGLVDVEQFQVVDLFV